MKASFQKHAEKVRFITVGLINTAIDFILLFALTHFGVGILVANFISTSAAFSFSFVANRNFTFKSKDKKLKRQLLWFLGVTLFGLWILQPIVISVVNICLNGRGMAAENVLFISKLLATIVTLIWNYTLYSRVVFKSKDSDQHHRNDLRF